MYKTNTLVYLFNKYLNTDEKSEVCPLTESESQLFRPSQQSVDKIMAFADSHFLSNTKQVKDVGVLLN